MELRQKLLPQISLNQIRDKYYARTHAFLTIHRKCEDDLVKRSVLNLEAFIRVEVNLGEGTGFIKVNEAYLDEIGITAKELWEFAWCNTKKTFRMFSMAELLDLPEELKVELGDELVAPFYVCTTDARTNGAVALIYPEIFREFCDKHQLDKCWLIPSSTEEVLIYTRMDTDPDELASMVKEINMTVVEPILQLDPVIYVYTRATDEITIVAEAGKE